MLNWSLIVCTLNRLDLLYTCLESVVNQSLLPQQIIVVDASNDWELSRNKILDSFTKNSDKIEWIYMGSAQKSLTYQRNQGLNFCRSEIVFFLDDDVKLALNYAEEIMKLYVNDKEFLLGGVMGVLVDDLSAPHPEDESFDKMEFFQVSKLLDQENLFIPYDGKYYNYDEAVYQLFDRKIVATVKLLHGCRMTFRMSAIEKAGRFSEILIKGGIAEDTDISYRVSRHSALVAARKAKMIHFQSNIGDVKRTVNTVLIVLNAIVLFRLNTSLRLWFKFFVYQFATKILLLQFCRDIIKGRFDLPQTKGAIYALKKIPTLMRMTSEELTNFYPSLQAEIMDNL